jgi:hypothetical protein
MLWEMDIGVHKEFEKLGVRPRYRLVADYAGMDRIQEKVRPCMKSS